MLALEHRISDDIDLFIRDPQWINYLTPRLNDAFESRISAYDEGSTSLKFKVGKEEIDFVVGASLLDLPDERDSSIPFALEPVDEVLAKKLFHRGWALTPRDLFDWHALGEIEQYDQTRTRLARVMTQGRLDSLESALRLLPTSSMARKIWGEIKTNRSLELDQCALWALHEVEVLAEMKVAASDQAPPHNNVSGASADSGPK